MITMVKGHAMRLPKVLKKLNLKPPSLKIWKKFGLESIPMSPAARVSRRDQQVRKGFFAVYVGKENKKYVIPVSHLKHPLFLQLLNRAEEEFGFCGGGDGGLQIPCDTAVFDRLLLFINRKQGGLHGGEKEELQYLFM